MDRFLTLNSDGQHHEAPISYYELRNKNNKNMGETYHLYPNKQVTTLNWEVSLRQKQVNPWSKKRVRMRKTSSMNEFGR